MLRKISSPFLIFIFFFSALGLAHAFAQTAPQKGVTVFPSIAHIDLAKDPPEYDLTYINNTDYYIELKLSVKDFTDLEDSYKISFLEGADAKNYKYSLSSWISFENKTIRLNPKEKKTVKVFIDKNRITKGGHYASILAYIQAPENKKAIDVKAILSSLLFVRASTGKEVEDGSISAFRPNREGLSFPESFTLRFQNSGNVHVIPYGLLQVYNSSGKVVAKGILNEDSLDALPESIRSYKISVKPLNSNFFPPGKYTAKIDITYGKNNNKLSAQTSFMTTGSLDLIQVIGFIAVIFGGLFLVRRKMNRN